MKEPIDVQYFIERSTWRAWLKKNFRNADEVWLIYPKKETGKPKILYNDAVEEALCFGWIDSTHKKYDDTHTMQRFTPRKSGSAYSQANKERLRWLSAHDRIHPDIQKEVLTVLEEPFVFSRDILAALQRDQIVWNHFENFSLPYRRIRIAYIESARKRPEEFEKRLSNFIEKTRLGKMIKGYGGIEKYY